VAAPERANLISVTEISFALKCTRHKASARRRAWPVFLGIFPRFSFRGDGISRLPPGLPCPLAGLTFIKSSLSAGQKFCTAALVDQSGPPADGDKLGSAGRK